MDESNIVFTVEAVTERAGQMLKHPRNTSRYLPAQFSNGSDRSGATTPNHTEIGVSLPCSSQLQFKFDEPPAAGLIYVFGSDPKRCDAYVGSRSDGISGQQFMIYFDNRRRLVLQDIARVGTSLALGPRGKFHIRKDFIWILFKNMDICFATNTGLKYMIRVKCHTFDQPQYLENLSKFLTIGRDIAKPLVVTSPIAKLALRISQGTSTGSLLLSPIRDPIYHFIAKIGSGGFGTVHKVVDVSTGHVYAAEKFDIGQSSREVRLLKKSSHPKIVRFAGAGHQDGEDMLLMEYVAFGSLRDANKKTRISKSEAVQCLLQGLCALDYLQEQNITHRDIKPEDILVDYREGGQIKTKIADFGLSRDRSFLITKGGTPAYAPPETFDEETSGSYSPYLVDSWSLGVVFIEYYEGWNIILQYIKHESFHHSHRKWCQWLQTALRSVQFNRPDKPILELAESVVQTDSRTRMSAKEAVEYLDELPSLSNAFSKAFAEAWHRIRSEPPPEDEPTLWDNDPECEDIHMRRPALHNDPEERLETDINVMSDMRSLVELSHTPRDNDAFATSSPPNVKTVTAFQQEEDSPDLSSEASTIKVLYHLQQKLTSQAKARATKARSILSAQRNTVRKSPQRSILAPIRRGPKNWISKSQIISPRPSSFPCAITTRPHSVSVNLEKELYGKQPSFDPERAARLKRMRQREPDKGVCGPKLGQSPSDKEYRAIRKLPDDLKR